MNLPQSPACAFASDNAAGAHPHIIEAIVKANAGHALAYGEDTYTRRTERLFNEVFGAEVTTLLTFNGTGSNVLALASMLQPAQAVVCTNWAHIAVDETGAPERILGAKLIDLVSPEGKLVPEQIEQEAEMIGVVHHAQPGVVSITQSTELGTLYTIDEIGELCDATHRAGMKVHLDGARIANAAAALGGTVESMRAFTIDAGVDVVSFGGTKNGLLGGEAVVYLDTALAERAPYIRKQVNQLPSKMRFIAAQFNALLEDGLWLDLAAHSNAMASRLHELTKDIPGVSYDAPPSVNSVFPLLPEGTMQTLSDWCFFWPWDLRRNQARWMTSWDTTDEDVRQFALGVHEILT